MPFIRKSKEPKATLRQGEASNSERPAGVWNEVTFSKIFDLRKYI